MSEAQNSRTDLELVASINSGDSQAFEMLYMRYRDWVYQLAYRLCGSDADAQDVLQETFAYLVRKFPGFELTSSMKTFLYPAVRNHSIAVRKKNRRSIQSETSLDDLPAAPNTNAGDRLDDLQVVVASLPEVQRCVLLMRYVDGMNIREIASALNVPVGTVKSRLFHASKFLRASPRAREYFGEPKD